MAGVHFLSLVQLLICLISFAFYIDFFELKEIDICWRGFISNILSLMR